MLRNRSLGTIVGAGFASLLVMIAALMALAIREVAVAQDQRRDMVAALELAEAADRLALYVSRSDSAFRDFILSREPQALQAARHHREAARLAAAELRRVPTPEPESLRLADLVVQAAASWDRQQADAESVAGRLRPEGLVLFHRQYLDRPTADVVNAADGLRKRLGQEVATTRNQLSRRGDRLSQALIIGFGLAGLVGVLLGIYFVRLVTEPVSRLVSVADAVRAGDYPVARRLVAEESLTQNRPSENEITQLSQTFAHMAETLEEREQRLRSHAAHLAAANRELASLQLLTDVALSELDPQELLEQLLGRIVSGLGADAGIVFLESPAAARLAPRALVGIDTDDTLIKADLTSEFARAVAEGSRLLIVPDQAAEPSWSASLPAARGAGAFMAVPLQVSEQAAGAAYIEFQAPRRFEPSQIHLMQAFAERLERALERARAAEEAAAWQRNLERQVAQQQDQLLRSERLASIGMVGGGIAHELRNPLGVISNSIFFLRNRLLSSDEKVTRHLDIIAMEVDQCKRIINNLVDFSTSIEPVTTRVDLNVLIESALESASIPPEVQLEVALHKPLPLLLGDETQLVQVFDHLIRNGVQALEGSGRLRIVTEVDGSRVRASIADTGLGIPDEDQQQIFEPLFSKRAKGMGLGLTLSRRIVEAHGGEISLVSKPGHGSTFIVELPVTDSFPSSSVSAADATGSSIG